MAILIASIASLLFAVCQGQIETGQNFTESDSTSMLQAKAGNPAQRVALKEGKCAKFCTNKKHGAKKWCGDRGKCSTWKNCKGCSQCATTINTTPAPTPAPVVPANPCTTGPPVARKYDAMQPVLVQAKSQKEASAAPAWAYPIFGVFAMFSFAGFMAVRVRRGRQTRQIQVVEPTLHNEEFDEEPLLNDELEDFGPAPLLEATVLKLALHGAADSTGDLAWHVASSPSSSSGSFSSACRRELSEVVGFPLGMACAPEFEDRAF